MRNLKIAQVGILWYPIPPLNYGGIEMRIKAMIDDFMERGHEVTLFATADCNTQAELHAVLERYFVDLSLSGEANMYEYYMNTTVAEVFQRQKEFDIIHFHAAPACIPFISLFTTPCLHTYTNPLHVDDLYVVKRFPNVAISGISHSQMKTLSDETGRRFPIVYNGIDFDKYEPSFEKGSYLAFLGKMSPVKNPVAAIEIAGEAGLPIVLAGEPTNPGEEEYFETKVKPLLNNKTVLWLGAVNHEQKNELLKNAAALLFPIDWEEAFGNVMIEAMACGTPVIARKRGSVPEIIEPGVNGFYADEVENMHNLVPDALKLDRKKVRDFTYKKFCLKNMAEGYLDQYHQLIGKKTEARQATI